MSWSRFFTPDDMPRRKKSGGRKYVIVKGRAYPVGSVKAKKGKRIMGYSSDGYGSMFGSYGGGYYQKGSGGRKKDPGYLVSSGGQYQGLKNTQIGDYYQTGKGIHKFIKGRIKKHEEKKQAQTQAKNLQIFGQNVRNKKSEMGY